MKDVIAQRIAWKSVQASVGVACVVVLAGCSVVGGASEPEPDPEAMTTLDSQPDADLASIVAGADRALILAGRASNVLASECMAEKGFSFTPVSTSTDVSVEPSGIGLALITVEEAREFGYTPYMQADESEWDGEPDLDGLAEMSDEEREAWEAALGGQEGDPNAETFTTSTGVTVTVSGCSGRAKRELYGDRYFEVMDTFDRLQTMMWRLDLESVAEVQQAEQRWSSCMADAGHDLATPKDAVDAGMRLRGDAAQPTEQEIELAVADVTCRNSSGFVDAIEDAFRRRNAEVLAQNIDLVLAWEELQDFMLQRTGEVLGADLS